MKRISSIVCGLVAMGAIVGCGGGSGNSAGGGGGSAAGGGGSTAGGGGSTAGGGGSSAGGGGTVAPADMTTPVTLPFPVDPTFAPSGFMGDGATAGVVTMLPAKATDSQDCNGDRSSSTAIGICHTVTYNSPMTPPLNWAGVYWQYPANNWGTKPGFTIPAGATKVSFSAKGAVGGEVVSFLAGGIAGMNMSYTDSCKATLMSQTLTTTWTQYSIDLTGQTYSQVLGGFGWTMAGPTVAGTPQKFFVDDIKWE